MSHLMSHFMPHLQSFTLLDEHVATVRTILANQAFVRRTLPARSPVSCALASSAIKDFICDSNNGSARLQNISANSSHYVENSQSMMPTSWVKTATVIRGMQRIQLNCAKTMQKVRELCKKTKLHPPKGFVKQMSHVSLRQIQPRKAGVAY